MANINILDGLNDYLKKIDNIGTIGNDQLLKDINITGYEVKKDETIENSAVLSSYSNILNFMKLITLIYNCRDYFNELKLELRGNTFEINNETDKNIFVEIKNGTDTYKITIKNYPILKFEFLSKTGETKGDANSDGSSESKKSDKNSITSESNKYDDLIKELKSSIKPYGILGVNNKGTVKASENIFSKIVILDPAGFEYVKGEQNLSNAGGASGIIYKKFSIKKISFVDDTKKNEFKELDAGYSTYNIGGDNECHIIHTVGFNFSTITSTLDIDKFQKLLTLNYFNIFREILKIRDNIISKTNITNLKTIRILPVSSDIFAHTSFPKPEHTAKAIYDAIMSDKILVPVYTANKINFEKTDLTKFKSGFINSEKKKIFELFKEKKIEICIFESDKFKNYQNIFDKIKFAKNIPNKNPNNVPVGHFI